MQKEPSAELLHRWQALPRAKPVLVLGDMMLERTSSGTTRRRAPDAPIPVILVDEQCEVPGGAANVAHNLARLACPVVALGFVGDDDEGRRLRALLAASDVDDGLLTLPDWPTILKTRVRCDGELVFRLDREQVLVGRSRERERLQLEMSSRFARGAAALVISDYAKGTLDGSNCTAVIQVARGAGAPVFVDPIGEDWSRYRGATGLFPNVLELARATGVEPTDTPALLSAAARLLVELELDFLLLKRDRSGMSLITADRTWTLPATATTVRDVSGAGDTVIATVVFGLQTGFSLLGSTHLANVAAGLVVAEVGTTPVDAAALRHAVSAGQPGGGAP